MSDILFIGGPAHGRVMNVPDDYTDWLVPVPAGQRSVLGEGGIPILSSLDRVRYVRRRFASPASRKERHVMAPADMPPAAAMEALADVLIRLWIESAPDADAQDESGPEPGPAATLAASE